METDRKITARDSLTLFAIGMAFALMFLTQGCTTTNLNGRIDTPGEQLLIGAVDAAGNFIPQAKVASDTLKRMYSDGEVTPIEDPLTKAKTYVYYLDDEKIDKSRLTIMEQAYIARDIDGNPKNARFAPQFPKPSQVPSVPPDPMLDLSEEALKDLNDTLNAGSIK